MDKIIIGIDISLNSSGFCISYNDLLINIASVNLRKFSSAKVLNKDAILEKHEYLRDLSMSYNDLFIIFHERLPMKKADGHYANARKRLQDSILLSNMFFDSIIRVLDRQIPNYKNLDIHIGIEDFSYGKDTNNIIQVCESSTSLKNLLTTKLQPNFDNYHIASAPEIKKFAGGGGYDKWQMVDSYLKTAGASTKKTNLYKLLSNDPSKFYTEKTKLKYNAKLKQKISVPIREMFSPVDDMVDAWWIMEWTKNLISQTT